MNTEEQVIKNTLEKAGYSNLIKYVGVGSDNYPNIIAAVVRNNQLWVTYLELSGWAKEVNYPIDDDLMLDC